MIESLEKAVQIDPSVQSYHILADAYSRIGEEDKAKEIRERIAAAVNSKNPLTKQIHQVRKVVM